jgi:hypothetical protein
MEGPRNTSAHCTHHGIRRHTEPPPKVHETLPHTALTMESGDTRSPHLVYFGKPARVADFKVLFCPVIMNYDDMLVRNTHDIGTPKRPRLERLNRKNNSQNGLRGMHVGLSRHSRTYMIWSPTTGKIYHTRDCIFDENFNSTLAYGDNKFLGNLKMMVTDGQPDFCRDTCMESSSKHKLVLDKGKQI